MLKYFTLSFLLICFCCVSSFYSLSTSRSSSSCAVGKRSNPYDALSELFTCLFTRHIANSAVYQKTKTVDFQAKSGTSNHLWKPLLKDHFSASDLSVESINHARFFDMISLFNRNVGINETRGSTEIAKIDDYMRLLLSSHYLLDTYTTLKDNDIVSGDYSTSFRSHLYNMWFRGYGRSSKNHAKGIFDSCGFEHVFLGEFTGTTGMTGLHSWLVLLHSEEADTFSYRGYIDLQPVPLISFMSLTWHGRKKSSGFMIGVPTEFEMALYSACFLLNPGRTTRLMLNGNRLNVQTFVVNHQTFSIGSSYAIAISPTFQSDDDSFLSYGTPLGKKMAYYSSSSSTSPIFLVVLTMVLTSKCSKLTFD